MSLKTAAPGSVSAQAEQIGNVAQTLLIANQTVNIGGRPEWIQTLSSADLQAVRDRLHHAARKHEGIALMPLLLPIALAFLVAGLMAAAFAGETPEVRHKIGSVVLLLAALIGLPTWFALYDVRRRHRRVVEAAERRWAELVVEIAAREDPPRREAPVKRLARWWRARRAHTERPGTD